MTKTELAIMEQIAQLDEASQQQVLELANRLASNADQSAVDLGKWLVAAQHLREEIRAEYGENYFFNSQSILDEIRDEESE